MPPQTRAATRRVVAPTPLDALPMPLALRILASLPADARLLAAAVCRSWRAMLADPALWTRLDLSEESGVANPSNALLRAAAARAGRQLEVLRTSLRVQQPLDVLLTVLAQNAGTMRELVLCAELVPSAVAALLGAAPNLRLLETCVEHDGVEDDVEDALPLLRKEPPFGPLRLKRIGLVSEEWPAAADALAAHTSLEVVILYTDWPEEQAESVALVGALLSLPQLHTLSLFHAPAPVLARLLGCPTLKKLKLYGGVLMDSPASAALLCDALRANTRLEEFELRVVQFWSDMDAATALLTTLQAHPSLQTVTLSSNFLQPEDAAAAGSALGALIAYAPALTFLCISECLLGDDGMGPIMDALPHARRLHTLVCTKNHLTEAFARERLLPAVRACAPLRTLIADYGTAVIEAQALLQHRR